MCPRAYRCHLCDTVFVARSQPPVGMECCTRGIVPTPCGREHAIVSQQNTRARKRHEPATLTLRQWSAALQYFAHHCAYCGGSCEVCDHVVPLGMGIGSTAHNCVPAGYACNIKKGGKHPATLQTLDLSGVQQYCASFPQ